MFGPYSPATLIVLAASVLLLLVSISTPIFRSIYFLSVDISPSTSLSSNRNTNVLSDLNGVIKLGLFGYCFQLGSQVACTSPQYGYNFDPNSLVTLPANLNLDASNWLLKILTYALILHPIAAGLAFLSAISGLISHFEGFSRSRATSWLSSLAAAVALCAFIFDILAFTLARNRINNTTNSNFNLNAQLGNAIWITLAGWISLALSGCLFCAGRRILSRRKRDQSQAHLIRPELDQDYSKAMREQAEKAEQDREKGTTPKPSNANLPAFAEYSDHDGRNQERIPLNSFQPDEENYPDHPARFQHHQEGEALEGVGAGYGRRQPQALSHHPSVMSQATMHSHVSHSQPPPMPHMPQPAQAYHNQFPSPSNHTPHPSDLYSNLPAHVTPASSYMNQPPQPNSTNRPHTNSIGRRLPQSLIPAGMPIPAGVTTHESNRNGAPRGSYASAPSSQTSVMPSSQTYELSQVVNHVAPSSFQSATTGLAYSTPLPASDPSEQFYKQHVNPQRNYAVNDLTTPKDSSSSVPPPIYETNGNLVDSNENHVYQYNGPSEPRNEDMAHLHNPLPPASQQNNRHDDPFTQTYDFGTRALNGHVTEEAAAGLADDHINASSHLLSPQREQDEYDHQSGADTDYTAMSMEASSLDQQQSTNRSSRRELPPVPLLPPLSFISPPVSPLHPRSHSDFTSRVVAAAAYDQTADHSQTAPPVYK